MSFETLKVATGDGICRIAFDRPQVGNAINARMIEDFASALMQCANEIAPDGKPVTVVVISVLRDHDSTATGSRRCRQLARTAPLVLWPRRMRAGGQSPRGSRCREAPCPWARTAGHLGRLTVRLSRFWPYGW